MVEAVRCEHCGAEAKHPVTKTIGGRVLNFCCAGCLRVYELLREEGVRPGQSGQGTPVRSKTEQVSTDDRQPGGTAPSRTVSLSIAGMTCANCVAHVEDGLRSVPGVLDVNVDLAAGRAKVDMIPGVVTITDLKHAVKDAGYEVLDGGDSEEEPEEHKHERQSEQRAPLAKLASIWKRRSRDERGD
jgi:copper chaperone CopZ